MVHHGSGLLLSIYVIRTIDLPPDLKLNVSVTIIPQIYYCSINHSKCHTRHSKMHDEHGKFIAHYTQRQTVLCISCAGLLTTNCKIRVPTSDTTPYGYMWVSSVPYFMKCILLLGISTYQHIIYCAIILLTCIQMVLG